MIAAAVLLLLLVGPLRRAARQGAAGGPPSPATASVVLALTTNAYSRPTRASDLVAIIPEGRSARLTGRTEEGDWLRVVYPPASSIEGWVPRANARAASLPDLRDLPSVPEAAAGAAGDGPGEQQGLPDLSVSSAEVQSSGALTVRITNAGPGTFGGRTDLQITSAEGTLLGAVDVDLSQSPLAPGRTAAVATGVFVRQTGLVLIEVDRRNTVQEASDSNNARRVLLVGTGG
ncbi:MAG: CARDB domain-containing protein [Dehalococcoidia bacterium]